jgi:hypothetical protein
MVIREVVASINAWFAEMQKQEQNVEQLPAQRYYVVEELDMDWSALTLHASRVSWAFAPHQGELLKGVLRIMNDPQFRFQKHRN